MYEGLFEDSPAHVSEDISDESSSASHKLTSDDSSDDLFCDISSDELSLEHSSSTLLSDNGKLFFCFQGFVQFVIGAFVL